MQPYTALYVALLIDNYGGTALVNSLSITWIVLITVFQLDYCRCGGVKLLVFSIIYAMCNAGHWLPDGFLITWRPSKCYIPNSVIFVSFRSWGFKRCNEPVSNLLIVSFIDAAWHVSLYRCTRGVCMAAWNLDTSCYQRSLDTSGGYWLCSSGCGM